MLEYRICIKFAIDILQLLQMINYKYYTMKQFILLVLLAVTTSVSMAQQNPKAGFIITNKGDTVRGTIDFRTNERLSRQCDFQANGTTGYKTYKPGDIEGFRFDNNGKYFVARRLNVTGTPELYFAEFIVQGKMNLYCVVNNKDEYFFFEREDGEMALLTNRTIGMTSIQALQDAKDYTQEKREQRGKVTTLIKDSWNAVEAMNENDMSRKKLVKVVRNYHNDVCTDGSKCMVYEYKDESDKVTAHFKAFAGYAHISSYRTNEQHYQDETYPGGAVEFGLGVEINLERTMKGLSVEVGVSYMPKQSSSHIVKDPLFMNDEFLTTIEHSAFSLSIGVVKRFGEGKIQPLVRVGAFGSMDLGITEMRERINNKNTVFPDIEWGNSMHYGAYIGAGVQMPIGKHFVRLHGDYHKSLETSGELSKFSITAEFGF